jgi:hypothetical protein
MAKIDQWRYGDSGETVKKIIDANFANLNDQVNQLTNRWEYDFKISDWVDGKISLAYSQYKKINPCVDLYIKSNSGYSPVYGGYEVKPNGIELQSDLAYEGKVVIR